jgi:hypothetical protein
MYGAFSLQNVKVGFFQVKPKKENVNEEMKLVLETQNEDNQQ